MERLRRLVKREALGYPPVYILTEALREILPAAINPAGISYVRQSQKQVADEMRHPPLVISGRREDALKRQKYVVRHVMPYHKRLVVQVSLRHSVRDAPVDTDPELRVRVARVRAILDYRALFHIYEVARTDSEPLPVPHHIPVTGNHIIKQIPPEPP